VRLRDETAARALLSRSILSDAIYELWGKGEDYESLHADIKRRTGHLWPKYLHDSFRFSVHGYQGKRSKDEQRSIIETFAYVGFQGPIKMKDADHEFAIHEDYQLNATTPKTIYFGRFVGSSGRSIVPKYDLKKRKYISTTSMDSELALISANMALAAPGKLAYDPFCGTGSFPIACAHFGALTLGSDIDGRAVRGTSDKNITSNFNQYELESQLLDNFTSDLTNTPLRLDRWLDAIICDPPYGVREGLKVLGMRKGNPTEPVFIDGVASYL
jgi:tRNA (guanine10-N2)-methyltransferase